MHFERADYVDVVLGPVSGPQFRIMRISRRTYSTHVHENTEIE